jgi:ribonuclease HI
MSLVKIYTDGACSGNPGKGGWGHIIIRDDKTLENYGGEQQTTNNRMELTAIIQGLSKCGDSEIITVFTDSKYVIDGVTSWMQNWKVNGWKTANKKPVKNKDLWEILDNLLETRIVGFEHVKAHNGDYYNERADTLAKLGINF